MLKKRLKEGNTYFTNDGKTFLVLEGSFVEFDKYLEDHPELKNGKYECRMISEDDIIKKTEITKGIFRIEIVDE